MHATQKALLKEYNESRSAEDPAHAYGSYTMLASPPRRIAWADMGGRVQHQVHIDANITQQIAHAVREQVYYAAYRILRKQELIANKNMPSTNSNTCALTGKRIFGNPEGKTKRERIALLDSAARPCTVFNVKPQQVGISCIPCQPPVGTDLGHEEGYHHGYPDPDLEHHLQYEAEDIDVFDYGGGLDEP